MPLLISAAPPYSVVAKPGSDLPPGLTINTVTLNATLTGFPTKAGAYAFVIEVTDAFGAKATNRAYIEVSAIHIVSTIPPGLYYQPYS